MNFKKVIITGIMLLSILTSSLVVNTFADDYKVSVSVDNKTAKVGEKFTVNISLTDVPSAGLRSCEFAVSYDNSIITVDSVSKGNIANTGADKNDKTAEVSIFDYNINNNKGIINTVWTTCSDSKYWINESGVMLTISGTVLNTAKNGDVADIKIIPIERKASTISSDKIDKLVFSYMDGSETAYYSDYSVANGSVTVSDSSSSKKIWGDANDDGKVDVADVVAIAAYVGNSYSNNLTSKGISNADVHMNGNGITADDALVVQQYIAKIVTELPIS